MDGAGTHTLALYRFLAAALFASFIVAVIGIGTREMKRAPVAVHAALAQDPGGSR